MQLTIYKIENKSNGKLYIGSTLKNFESRLFDHKLRSGGNRGLCEWYPEIDPNDLAGEILEVIENPSKEEVRLRITESRYCQYYRSLGYELYNKRVDATHHSSESKAKISASMLGKPCPEASKNALRAYAPQMVGNRHQDHHVIEYNGKVYQGSTELHQELLAEGYDLTYHQVNNLVTGFFSKKNKDRYPELLTALKIYR